MAMVQGKVHAVILESHRIVSLGGLNDLQMPDTYFVSARDARGASVLPDNARDDDGGFLGNAHDRVKQCFIQIPLEGNALDEAGAIPDEQETELAFIGPAVNPTSDDDILTDVVGNGFDPHWLHLVLHVALVSGGITRQS
jgi:hypothetical protein